MRISGELRVPQTDNVAVAVEDVGLLCTIMDLRDVTFDLYARTARKDEFLC